MADSNALTQNAQGRWDLTLKHNKSGVNLQIPARLTYDGSQVTATITDTPQTFNTDWYTDLGTPINTDDIDKNAQPVTKDGKTYIVNAWTFDVKPYDDSGITAETIYSVEVLPKTASMASNGHVSLTSYYVGKQDDTEVSRINVTDDATWSSDNDYVIVNGGSVSGNNTSSSMVRYSRVTAAYSGKTGYCDVTVDKADEPIIVTGTSLVVIATPQEIDWNGLSVLSANYIEYKSDGTSETTPNVPATFEITGGSSYASLSNNIVTGNNEDTESNRNVLVKGTYNGTTGETTITVKKKEEAPAEPTLELSISPFTSSEWVPASGSVATLTILSNTDWEIFDYTQRPFATIDGALTGSNNETRQITIPYNSDQDQRTTYISGTTTTGQPSATAKTSVVQSGATLVISADTHDVQAGSITHYVYISANTYWTLELDANWATINGSLTGFGNERREIYFEKNTGSSDRTAHVSAKTDGNKIVRSVEFVQNGAYIRTSESTLEFGGVSGQTKRFYIHTNLNGVELTCSDQDNRFQVQPMTGEGGTEITVTTIKNNDWGSVPISATITVSDADHTATRFTGTTTVNLVQDVIEEKPEIIISGASVDQIPNYGGEVTYWVYWNHTHDGVSAYTTNEYDAPLESGVVISGPNPTGSSNISSSSYVSFTVTFSPNQTDQERTIRFYVAGYAKAKSGGRGEVYKEYLELKQSAGYVTPHFEVNPSSIVIGSLIPITVDAVISFTGGTSFIIDWDTTKADLSITLPDSQTVSGTTAITRPGAEINLFNQPGEFTLRFDNRQSGLIDVTTTDLNLTMYDIIGKQYTGTLTLNAAPGLDEI